MSDTYIKYEMKATEFSELIEKYQLERMKAATDLKRAKMCCFG